VYYHSLGHALGSSGRSEVPQAQRCLTPHQTQQRRRTTSEIEIETKMGQHAYEPVSTGGSELIEDDLDADSYDENANLNPKGSPKRTIPTDGMRMSAARFMLIFVAAGATCFLLYSDDNAIANLLRQNPEGRAAPPPPPKHKNDKGFSSGNGNDGVGGAGPGLLSLEQVKRKHPLCFSDRILSSAPGTSAKERPAINFSELGRFVKNDETTDPEHYVPPRYDHQCFAMKSRYNCAYPPPSRETNSINGTTGSDDAARPEPATNYKLVLELPPPGVDDFEDKEAEKEGRVCNFRRLVADLGGPIGVARAVQELHGSGSHADTSYSILGNSYLRQVTEALECGWKDQITDLMVHVGGPPSDLNALDSPTLIHLEEMGVIDHRSNVSNSEVDLPEGCHGTRVPDIDLSGFYREGVVVPPQMSSCNDHVASVIFGGQHGEPSLRFTYMFRHMKFADLIDIYHMLGVDDPISEVDRFVVVDESDIMDESNLNLGTGVYGRTKNSTAVRRHVQDNMFTFPEISNFRLRQKKNIGRWFGADNPWLDEVPDTHACMPGVPDDEADLLLFAVLLQANIV